MNADGEVLYARVSKDDAAKINADSIEKFLAEAAVNLNKVTTDSPTWNYSWDLILANPHQITDDFKATGDAPRFHELWKKRFGKERKPRPEYEAPEPEPEPEPEAGVATDTVH